MILPSYLPLAPRVFSATLGMNCLYARGVSFFGCLLLPYPLPGPHPIPEDTKDKQMRPNNTILIQSSIFVLLDLKRVAAAVSTVCLSRLSQCPCLLPCFAFAWSLPWQVQKWTSQTNGNNGAHRRRVKKVVRELKATGSPVELQPLVWGDCFYCFVL